MAAASISGSVTSFVGDQGVYAVFLLMAMGAVFPAASELVMIYAGALASGAFVAQHVAPHKRIRMIELIDKVPKSPSGKILRRILVERERARRGEAVLPDTPTPQSVSSR